MKIKNYLDKIQEFDNPFKKKPTITKKIDIKGKIAIGNKENLKQGAQTIVLGNFFIDETYSKNSNMLVLYVNENQKNLGIESINIGQTWKLIHSDYNSDYYNRSIETYIKQKDMISGTYNLKGEYTFRESRIPLNTHSDLKAILSISFLKGMIFKIELYNGEGIIERLK